MGTCLSGELQKGSVRAWQRLTGLGSEEALSDIETTGRGGTAQRRSLYKLLGEVMMWVVSEMLRAMTGGPSYVPRESVCTQEEPPQQVQAKYEAQRNEEVSTRTCTLDFLRKMTFRTI